MRPRLIATIASIAGLLLAPQVALAAVSPQAADGDTNLGFLVAGTALAWVGFIGYAFYLGRRNRDMRREIEELRKTLEENKK